MGVKGLKSIALDISDRIIYKQEVTQHRAAKPTAPKIVTSCTSLGPQVPPQMSRAREEATPAGGMAHPQLPQVRHSFPGTGGNLTAEMIPTSWGPKTFLSASEAYNHVQPLPALPFLAQTVF